MYVSVYAREGSLQPRKFELIRELVVADPGPARAPALARMAACSVPCRRGRPALSGAYCLSCPRLVNFVPRDGGMWIRCLWRDDDPVVDVMAPVEAYTTVDHAASVTRAHELARNVDAEHLLITDGDLLVGVVRVTDLEAPGPDGETVRSRIQSWPWVVEVSAGLAQVIELMARRGVSCVPVVGRDRKVHGIITRTDLTDLGIDDRRFEPNAAAAL